MRHKIFRIIYNMNDYKTCNHCKALNWYENIECLNCDSTDFNYFDTEREQEDYIEYLYETYQTFNIEIEV